MMDGVKEWVKGLVLLALLASCLELMLPMGKMKRYVKLTMGLLIVLATLKPVFGLLGQEVALTAGLFEVDAGAAKGVPTLGEIMARAQDFREKNKALAVGEVSIGLAEEAARAARSVTGVADAEADVDLKETSGEVEIRSVTVRITPGEPGGTKPVQPVEPVKPVGTGSGGRGGTGQRLTAEEQKLSDAVRREVAARLGIEAEASKVKVLIERQGR